MKLWPEVLLVVLLYVAAVVLNYGYMLGSLNHDFPWNNNNQRDAVTMSIPGPVMLPTTIFFVGTKHWAVKGLTAEQRWQAFHNVFPWVSRSNFDREYN